jgi:hypothetical protein
MTSLEGFERGGIDNVDDHEIPGGGPVTIT